MGVEDPAPHPRTAGWDLARVAGFFLVCLLGTMLGRLTYIESSQVVLISPLAGLGFLWLASGSPRREWWWDVPALTATQLLATWFAGGTSGQLVGGVLLTWVQPVTTVLVLRRLAPDLWGGGGRRPLGTVRDLAAFLAACVVGSTLSAALRWWGLGLVPSLDLAGFGMAWIRNFCWILAFGLIGLQVAPILARARDPRVRRQILDACSPGTLWHFLEGVLVIALTMGLYVTAFELPVTFAISLVTVWAALRFSVVSAEVHAFASGTTALLMTLNGAGVFAAVHSQLTGAALAQAFMIVLTITAAVVGLSSQARRQSAEHAIVSERTAAERAHLLDSVMENMSEGLVVVQDDGQILVRNPAGRELVGLADVPPESDVQAASTYGLHQLDGTPLPEDQMPAALAFAGHEVIQRDYLLRSPRFPEGRILEMSVSNIPESLSEGRRRVIINFRDVTRARQDRDNLASFAGVVAHDLLSPLAIVDGWGEALAEAFLEGPVDPADGGAMVSRITGASGHMRRFIDDLLGYVVARDQPLRSDDLDITALIEDVATMRRQGDSRPRITVQEGMQAHGDPALLRQLFDNLLGNAVKYVAPGVRPNIVVSAEPTEGDFVRLTVDDNGIGVPVEQRHRIFENFQRAATDYSGTGIGLAICTRIVQRHGGTISVEDNPARRGSRFAFTLPSVIEEPDVLDESMSASTMDSAAASGESA